MNTNSSPDYESYLSPFTWRYGSPAMRQIWSEAHKRRLWRRLWVALAEAQAEFGLVTPEQAANLRQHMEQVDVPRALAIEAEIQHDLMAELKAFAEQAPLGGKILHLGATSTDIEDNADVLRLRQSLELLLEKLSGLLMAFAEKIDAYADTPLMAFTHLQPAEPSTLGYRLAQYAQDLLLDWQALSQARQELRGKGFKGAVGASAAYAELLGVENLPRFEQRLSELLELPFFPVATQVYPRKQDYLVTCALAGLGGSLYRFAFDLRLLQSPPIGELSEPFGQKQVGSSAMPFKRNPVSAEKIDSLARLLAQAPRLAWDNAAHSLLERTLDDSANRRILLPEAFLAADELLITASRIISGLQVNLPALQRNLAIYGPFAATERVLMALGKAGADRQAMHERLRQHALTAWQAVQSGGDNPLVELVAREPEFCRYLPEAELRSLMDASQHLGDAAERAREMAREIVKIF
ncbi:MAG: adenylosuccinate lyase [Anaerolineales bacterium]|nr:adenylosuccinate lyase [Anaerolineales bacterium]